MKPPPEQSWVVLKFGGSSVATARGWGSVARRMRALVQQGERPLVVCSAVGGVSDALERLIDDAVAGIDPQPAVDAIRRTHVELAAQLGVALPDDVSSLLDELVELSRGVALVGEASPRVRARMLSAGELMSTRLGAIWLGEQGLPVTWLDARSVLRSTADTGANHYLSASVDAAPLPEGTAPFDTARAVLTQGFIARDTDGDTALLGRGGSDTSAAYFGVLVRAARVEIWTDVKGLFTANPRVVPGARVIEGMDYDEAGAFAGLGAKVLHPRCIPPVREAGIPLYVRSTYEPDAAGTRIGPREDETTLRGVTSRKGLTHLELCRPASWQPVGFVADVASVFKQHGLSIDLMSTAPSTIAITVDPASAPLTSLVQLIDDLSQVAEVRSRNELASVSLVGTGVRAAFDRLGGAVAHLQDLPLAMVVQGAADHHLTFVLPEEHADTLVRRLHATMFEGTYHRAVERMVERSVVAHA